MPNPKPWTTTLSFISAWLPWQDRTSSCAAVSSSIKHLYWAPRPPAPFLPFSTLLHLRGWPAQSALIGSFRFDQWDSPARDERGLGISILGSLPSRLLWIGIILPPKATALHTSAQMSLLVLLIFLHPSLSFLDVSWLWLPTASNPRILPHHMYFFP